MTITNITIENFCGITGQKSFNFGQRTIVKGRNAVGKSTVKKAIQYVLDCKDENGKEIAGIRPHDKNGVDIDGLVTSVKMTILVDGAENTLEKRYFQKKNRQGEYTGESDTQYFIDGVKKSTKKDYDAFIQTFLSDEKCINAQRVLAQDTAGRRKEFEVFSERSVEDIIAENPAYEPLRGKLKANTTQELKKACRERIEGTKGNNAQKGLKDKLEEINYSIKIAEQNKQEIDVAELELQKKAIEEQITEVEAKEADISKQFAEQDKIVSEIASLRRKLEELQEESNAELRKKNAEFIKRYQEKKSEENDLEFVKSQQENFISQMKGEVQRINGLLQHVRDKYTLAINRIFDENSLVCSYCGKEYPEDQKEQKRAEFERQKQEELALITEQGNGFKCDLDSCNEKLVEYDDELKEIRKKLEAVGKEVAELEKEGDALPQSVDISNRDDVKEIKQQIEEKQKSLTNTTDATEIRQELSKQKSELQAQLLAVMVILKTVEENVKADEQIADLQRKQKEVSQEIATVKGELDLIKQFERRKAELLKEDVNKCFEFIQIEMTEQQQDGNLRDVCKIKVDGEDFDRNLNFSSRLLTEVDICRGFQQKYGVELPILLDNCESISNDRLPEISNQLIMFRVPYIPDKPIILNEEMAEEGRQKLLAEWEEEKKRLEEYYSELRVEVLGD